MYVSELLFLWQTQIQTIEYGLNDAKRIKKETSDIALILWSFTPSDMNFQTISMAKGIFAKFLFQKSGPLEPFLYQICFTISLNIYAIDDVKPFATFTNEFAHETTVKQKKSSQRMRI